MEKPLKGDVVILPFPFSDLTQSKKRPAVVIASLDGDDVILCQITSKARWDKYAIKLSDKDFSRGSLKVESFLRPNRMFTADKSLVLYKVGTLKMYKIDELIKKIVEILQK